MQLKRTVIVGNSGSGKTRLAQQIADALQAPGIDLDRIHWKGDAYGSKRDEIKAREMVVEAAEKPTWVIEGVFGWLARVALPRATALIWLDLSWEECHAGLMERGPRKGMTESDYANLIAWAEEYWTRDNANSFGGHLRLFEPFAGSKLRLTRRSDVDRFWNKVPGGGTC